MNITQTLKLINKSSDLSLPRKITIGIIPEIGDSLIAQFSDCMQRLNATLHSNEDVNIAIINQTIFIRSFDNESFSQCKHEVVSFQNEFYQASKPPPTSVVCLLPETGKLVSLEVILLVSDKINNYIQYKSFKNINYSIVSFNTHEEIFIPGICSENNSSDRFIQSKEVFDLANEILLFENLSFSDVVRQWNYLEQICSITEKDNLHRQNYQVFNAVRSDYYSESVFLNGFPASTGIGMYAGGIIIDIIAIKINEKTGIHALNNPFQLCAHSYTEEVLSCEKTKGSLNESTPKFERGKLIFSSAGSTLYISGTAAIRGQNTVSKHNTVDQTIITIENIEQLISESNLEEFNLPKQFLLSDLSNLRVYIKNEEDMSEVKALIKEQFENINVTYVIADICRPDLLVEIEGEINF